MASSRYMAKAMLDWMLGGATPTRPAAHFVGLAIGSPTFTSASEATASGYARQTVVFSPAVTGAATPGTCVNSAAFTFTFSAAQTVSGIQVWDTNLSSNSGNCLFQGLLSTASVMAAGDTLAFAASALGITLQ